MTIATNHPRSSRFLPAAAVLLASALAAGSPPAGLSGPGTANAGAAGAGARAAAPAPSWPVLSGTITSAATGRPLAKAGVEVFEQAGPERARERRLRGEVQPEPLARAATDGSGSFRVAVPPGVRLLVVAEAPGHARSLIARPLAVTKDRDLGEADLPAGRKLSGRVVDPGGAGVPGAAVVAFVERDGPRGGAGASFIRSVAGPGSQPAPVFGRTGPDGRFSLEGIPQRPVTIRALAEGRAPGLVESVGASTGVVVRLAAGHTVEGRAVAPDGRTPVAGAWVLAGDLGWDGIARTGADGTFRIERVRPGAASLVAMMPETEMAASPAAPGAAPAAPISAAAPSGTAVASTPEVTLALSVGEAGIRDRGAVSLGSEAVPKEAAGAKAGAPAARPEAPAATSAARKAGPAAPAPATAAAAYAPSPPVTVTVPPARQAAPPVLRLRPGGIVQVRVLDAETRDPIPGAWLTLDAPGESRPRPAATDASGRAVFAGVPAGTVGLRVEAEDHLDEEVPPSPLAAGQTRDVAVALRPAASLEGTVRDAAGRPVAGAEVSIAGPPPVPIPLPTPIFFPIGVDPVRSDAQGRFLLDGLPSKVELKLSVASAAYAPWEEAGVRLRPGERRRGVDVLLDAGLLITGRLVDQEGRPVAAASVTASRRPEGGPAGMVIRIGGPGGGRGGPRGAGAGARGGLMGGEDLPEVYPDADGRFTVRGAKPGIWEIEVAAPGFAPKSVAGLKLEEPGPLDAGTVVLEPGVVLEGIVTTEAGAPVPYARCRVVKELSALSEFLTREDGSFTSGALAPGSNVTLTVDADGYAAVERPGLTPPVAGLAVTLKPASRILGRVVEKESGRPVPDFGIAASRSRSAGGGGMRLSMEMQGGEVPFHSEDGAFVLEDVDPGKVTLAARAPGYQESVLRDLEVPEGDDLDGVVFALDRSASVSGVVVGDAGRPVPGAAVERKAASVGGFGPVVRAGGGRGRATTDGDGRFVLEGLERGPMTISVSHPDYEPADVDVDTTRDVEGLRVALSRGGTLSGVVLHEDGSPVPKASVAAVAAGSDRFGGARSLTAGADGAFTFEGLPAGRYTVRAEAAGLTPAAAENVVVAPGPPSPPVELRMSGGVTLSGSITGVKEADLPRFTVRVVAGAGGLGRSAPVDAAGRFEVKGLAPGPVTLMAGSGLFGGRSMARTIQIPEGVASYETVLEFPRGNVVEGTVTRGGRPVAGASVIFQHAALRTSVTAVTDAAGSYTAEDLDDGTYNVTVLLVGSGLSHATEVAVEADRTLDVELPLARITGTVTDAVTRQPVEGAEVGHRRQGEGQPLGGSGFIFMRAARTDSSGFFQIEGLEDGAYDLTVRKEGYAFERRPVVIVPNLEVAEVAVELEPAEGITLRVEDAASGLPLRSVGALVVTGGGDPLAPGGSGASVAHQGTLAAEASGLFRLRTLRPGTYRVVLGGSGLATETIHDVEAPASELAVRMAPGGTLEVRAPGLKPGETARAVLLDGRGRPVHVWTFPAEPAFILRPDDPRVIPDVKPGSYVLRAALPGGGSRDVPVTVTAGATTSVAIP